MGNSTFSLGPFSNEIFSNILFEQRENFNFYFFLFLFKSKLLQHKIFLFFIVEFSFFLIAKNFSFFRCGKSRPEKVELPHLNHANIKREYWSMCIYQTEMLFTLHNNNTPDFYLDRPV
jgi:hypothetical protein